MAFEPYMWPDLFTAPAFRRLDERIVRMRRREWDSRRRSGEDLDRLENDVARVALLARALAELGLKKGLFTREELLAQLLESDMSDGAEDHKLAPDVVMPGEEKLADLEPERPPRRRRRAR